MREGCKIAFIAFEQMAPTVAISVFAVVNGSSYSRIDAVANAGGLQNSIYCI